MDRTTSPSTFYPALSGGDWFAVIESFTACLQSREEPVPVHETIVDGMLLVRARVGDLDTDRLEITYDDGILEIRIPVNDDAVD